MRTLRLLAAVVGALCLAVLGLGAVPALASPEWHLEQPPPPAPEPGVAPAAGPVGLGHVGDIEFFAPNLGVLTTAGNGSTIPAGIWVYDGEGWHELSNQCGGADGRIAWAGPDEFWAVANGRPGQAANASGELPPLEDDTLCHFVSGAFAGSYAAPAFQASSYRPMDAAACNATGNCWFAGARLPGGQQGAFQLHWNGTSLSAEPNLDDESIGSIANFEGNLLESFPVPQHLSEEEIEHPALLREIEPGSEGESTFAPRAIEGASGALPDYAPGSFPQALGYLHLSAAGSSLWAGAESDLEPPHGSAEASLTLLHDSGGAWTQVLGPEGTGSETQDSEQLSFARIEDLAAEPGSEDAWLALDNPLDAEHPSPSSTAQLLRVGAGGELEETVLPSTAEKQAGQGPTGPASRIACPAPGDCWMATAQGWLYHLSEPGRRTLEKDADPAFNGPLITYRPPDQGLPAVQSTELPENDSEEGSTGPSAEAAAIKEPKVESFVEETVPLLSALHSRLIHRSILKLSFHLAVEAKVELVAELRHRVVAHTPTRTLKAGNRSLELRLNPHRWPNRLRLETHALAPLPKVSSRGNNVESFTTKAIGRPLAELVTGGGWDGSL
jgi:hypothetical protein